MALDPDRYPTPKSTRIPVPPKMTPLCGCVQEEKMRKLAVQLLLSRGADVNARDDSGRTAFSYACEMHCNDVVQLLIRNNVDPDIPDNSGQSYYTQQCIISQSILLNKRTDRPLTLICMKYV